MVCSIQPFARIDCGFELLTGRKCDSYPRRLEVTAVVDCIVDQSDVVDCGFTGAWGIAV